MMTLAPLPMPSSRLYATTSDEQRGCDTHDTRNGCVRPAQTEELLRPFADDRVPLAHAAYNTVRRHSRDAGTGGHRRNPAPWRSPWSGAGRIGHHRARYSYKLFCCTLLKPMIVFRCTLGASGCPPGACLAASGNTTQINVALRKNLLGLHFVTMIPESGHEGASNASSGC